jgi:hypothetical protein
MSLVGRLEDLALPDIFQIISLSKKTGSLVVRSRQGTGIIVFRNGQVVQAGSDVIRDSLGNILVSQGMINSADLSAALAAQKAAPDKPLGMILIESGAVPAKTVEEVVRLQIEEIISGLLGWEEGFFNFELGDVASGDAIEVNTQDFLLKSGISAEHLLMEGTRLLDEKRKDRHRKERSAAPPPAELPAAPASPPDPVVRLSSEPAREEFRARIESAAPSREIITLRSMFDELRFPTATAEVTLLILRYSSEVVNRAILFMVKKDEVRGLGQFGIELESGRSADQVVRNIRIPLSSDSLFKTVLTTRRTHLGPLEPTDSNFHFINTVGGIMPDAALAIPLIVDEKVALIVYGDNLPEKKAIQGVETLEIFMNQAGMALEKALLERRIAELQKEKQ